MDGDVGCVNNVTDVVYGDLGSPTRQVKFGGTGCIYGNPASVMGNVDYVEGDVFEVKGTVKGSIGGFPMVPGCTSSGVVFTYAGKSYWGLCYGVEA